MTISFVLIWSPCTLCLLLFEKSKWHDIPFVTFSRIGKGRQRFISSSNECLYTIAIVAQTFMWAGKQISNGTVVQCRSALEIIITSFRVLGWQLPYYWWNLTFPCQVYNVFRDCIPGNYIYLRISLKIETNNETLDSTEYSVTSYLKNITLDLDVYIKM